MGTMKRGLLKFRKVGSLVKLTANGKVYHVIAIGNVNAMIEDERGIIKTVPLNTDVFYEALQE
jgi:hypothetical protein